MGGNGAPVAAGVAQAILGLERLIGRGQHLADDRLHLGQIIRVDELERVAPQELLGGITQEGADGGAEVIQPAVLAHHANAVGAVLDQPAKALLAGAQGLLGRARFQAQAVRFQGAADGVRQPRQAALHQIVSGATLDDSHSLLFADRAGDQDKGDVESAGLQQLQGARAAEARQLEIAQHNLPRLAGGQAGRQRGQVGGLTVHALGARVKARPAQLQQQQFGVVGLVFYQQRR